MTRLVQGVGLQEGIISLSTCPIDGHVTVGDWARASCIMTRGNRVCSTDYIMLATDTILHNFEVEFASVYSD